MEDNLFSIPTVESMVCVVLSLESARAMLRRSGVFHALGPESARISESEVPAGGRRQSHLWLIQVSGAQRARVRLALPPSRTELQQPSAQHRLIKAAETLDPAYLGSIITGCSFEFAAFTTVLLLKPWPTAQGFSEPLRLCLDQQ